MYVILWEEIRKRGSKRRYGALATVHDELREAETQASAYAKGFGRKTWIVEVDPPIDPAILDNLQDLFAERPKLSIVGLDEEGRPV